MTLPEFKALEAMQTKRVEKGMTARKMNNLTLKQQEMIGEGMKANDEGFHRISFCTK